MKRVLVTTFAASVAAVLAAAPIVDAARHSVTFNVKTTGLREVDKVEFLFVGPDSDNDYEALFETEDSIADLVSALDRAGIPRGRDFDSRNCRFWPVGEFLAIEPALTNFMKNVDNAPFPSIVYSGGRRDSSGVPEAHTNSPCAFFALYNCPQSILQFDASLDQSPTYGRFVPTCDTKEGERHTFTLTWNGRTSVKPFDLKVEPGTFGERLRALKDGSFDSELDVLPDFSKDLSLKEAVVAATAMTMIDSSRVKMNGFKDGQFFYRAFVPMEKWRDRKERLAQPPEIHFSTNGTFVVTEIIEDWSDEKSIDPKLIVKDHPASSPEEAARIAKPIAEKTYTAFFYAPEDTKLEKLYEFKKLLTSDLIFNWYVFTE